MTHSNNINWCTPHKTNKKVLSAIKLVGSLTNELAREMHGQVPKVFPESLLRWPLAHDHQPARGVALQHAPQAVQLLLHTQPAYVQQQWGLGVALGEARPGLCAPVLGREHLRGGSEDRVDRICV